MIFASSTPNAIPRFPFVIPAKAGIKTMVNMDSGLRRSDGFSLTCYYGEGRNPFMSGNEGIWLAFGEGSAG